MSDEETIGISIEEMGDDTCVGCTHTCIPKLVFVIPYRDRKEHLEQFRLHMNMILEDVDPRDYFF